MRANIQSRFYGVWRPRRLFRSIKKRKVSSVYFELDQKQTRKLCFVPRVVYVVTTHIMSTQQVQLCVARYKILDMARNRMLRRTTIKP